MPRPVGIGAEKVRTAVSARRFTIGRIVQRRAGACLCDCPGEKAAGAARILMIENCVRIAPLVGDGQCDVLIPVGAATGELSSLRLPRRVKSKSPGRAIGLLLDRHRQRKRSGTSRRRVRRRLRSAFSKRVGAGRQPCGRRKRPRHARPVNTLSLPPKETCAMTPSTPQWRPFTPLHSSVSCPVDNFGQKCELVAPTILGSLEDSNQLN